MSLKRILIVPALVAVFCMSAISAGADSASPKMSKTKPAIHGKTKPTAGKPKMATGRRMHKPIVSKSKMRGKPKMTGKSTMKPKLKPKSTMQ